MASVWGYAQIKVIWVKIQGVYFASEQLSSQITA